MPFPIPIRIEDPRFLVVEKPPKIPTQPLASGSDVPVSLAEILSECYPELKSVGGRDMGAVHRLDIETSGLVVFARDEETYRHFRQAFSSDQIEKEYVALIEGNLSESGKVLWPIGPDPKTKKKVRVYRNRAEAIRYKAQEAITYYEPLRAPFTALPTGNLGQNTASGPATLLRLRIKTGRRHQIRIHLASLGHPIIGDSLYGNVPRDRLYLHASLLGFEHPTTGERMIVRSTPPFT